PPRSTLFPYTTLFRSNLRGGVLFSICLTVAMAAQQPTFKVGTQLVSVFATVTDAQKRLVPNLVQEDFEVLDNEKPQPLIFFENRSEEHTSELQSRSDL